jgi:hypothetical protein
MIENQMDVICHHTDICSQVLTEHIGGEHNLTGAFWGMRTRDSFTLWPPTGSEKTKSDASNMRGRTIFRL